MISPINGLCSTSITSPSIQSGWAVSCGLTFILSPIFGSIFLVALISGDKDTKYFWIHKVFFWKSYDSEVLLLRSDSCYSQKTAMQEGIGAIRPMAHNHFCYSHVASISRIPYPHAFPPRSSRMLSASGALLRTKILKRNLRRRTCKWQR